MRARVLVALKGNAMPENERYARTSEFMAQLERAEFVGEGDSWDVAYAAAIAQVPADGLVLYCEDPDR